MVFVSFADGAELYRLAQADPVRMHLAVDAIAETRTTRNIIADTAKGRIDRVVVVGGHLDSVIEGPGINDNGSGTSTILEIALQMARLKIKPLNKVRFAFWGAEELGLLGSTYYVANLSTQARRNIDLNLNFDMLGSPNYARLVYDGDGSLTPADPDDAGPEGSDTIEQVFLGYFAGRNLATEATPFDGRSDYGPSSRSGSPPVGCSRVPKRSKTPAQAAKFGGTAGVAYDQCYHQACDNLDNNNDQSLDELGDAATHAVLQFAMTTSPVRGISMARDEAVMRVPVEVLAYRGTDLQR